MSTIEIPLTRGKTALIDRDDFHLVVGRKWQARPNMDLGWYASAYTYERTTRKRRHLAMHRVIMDAPAGMEVDHINGNGIDNRRCNLRLCTKSQNSMNANGRRNTSSRFKGVYRKMNRWGARIGKRYLGSFVMEADAARAYDAAARCEFGEFAHPNFPVEDADD